MSIALTQFSHHLINEGKVKTTIQSYTTDIRGLLEWLSEKQVDFQGQLTRFYVTYTNNKVSVNNSIIDNNGEYGLQLKSVEEDGIGGNVITNNREGVFVNSSETVYLSGSHSGQ